MTKEEALNEAIKDIQRNGYIMTNDPVLLTQLHELEKDGILLRCDRAEERNPVGDFNPSYSFIEA